MLGFTLKDDVELVQELLGIDSRTLGTELGISRMTLSRWAKDPSQASQEKLESFYGFAFAKGIRLNEIHADLFVEETRARGLVPLFHGSKRGIEGPLSVDASRADNDFGKGFYCGESLEQAAMFVARFPGSVCYFVALDESGLSKKAFSVDEEWMLAIALYRGKVREFEGHGKLRAIAEGVASADCLTAPIADNRMFEIIDSFIDGELTDRQCEHSLSATNLGSQYVLRTDAALRGVVKLQPRFLCNAEREALLAARQERVRVSADKVKAAKRKFRAQGRYIEELLS